jgi:hypothetical protein
MRDAIIFDIDGTLSDVTHRRHHVTNGNRDWDAFFGAMGDDPVVEDVAWLFHRINESSDDGFDIFIFTGRPEKYREVTIGWLWENALKDYESMLMRPDGDYRPDTEIKREMLDRLRADGYNVRFVVDDRPSVVAMWRAEGLTVLQVDSGEWETKPMVDPGTLYLMVGPSGAGKSFVAHDQFDETWIVSSDKIREDIAGSFKDQSKNAEVIAALRALVQTRITHGLPTVVDATNLRNKDRRALRDLVSEDTKIIYAVVDRPLADKHRDSGWRAEVMIKGVKLVDRHDHIFQSNLKDIMAGDHDPRVTVWDWRGK